jgi:hypothetical protein
MYGQRIVVVASDMSLMDVKRVGLRQLRGLTYIKAQTERARYLGRDQSAASGRAGSRSMAARVARDVLEIQDDAPKIDRTGMVRTCLRPSRHERSSSHLQRKRGACLSYQQMEGLAKQARIC